jgi:NADH-quinone oxidoreductase subunit L
MLYSVAVFAPLAGTLVAGLLGPAIGDRAAELATILGMVVSATAGVIVMGHVAFEGGSYASVPIADWMQSGTFQAHWALRYDTLSAVMVGMVSFVSIADPHLHHRLHGRRAGRVALPLHSLHQPFHLLHACSTA